MVFLPIGFSLLINFHIGGIEIFSDFFVSAFNPKINKEIISILILRLNETILISVCSWIISIVLGIILGILSSNIFYEFLKIPALFKGFIVLIITLMRSLHELVWCLILMQIFGINQLVGILAISIPFTAINAKVIREQIDTINSKSIKSLVLLKDNNLSALLTLIWHPILKTINNFGFYRIECTLRSTAILGLFGIGGIGTSLFLSFQTLNFREMWTYLWAFAFLTILVKEFTKKLKIKNINLQILILFISIVCPILIYYFYISTDLIINYLKIVLPVLEGFSFLSLKNIPDNYIESIFETIFLSFLATGIAISLPPSLLLISQNKNFIILLRIIAFWFRLIPPPIIILILLMFNEPSLSLAVITLGLHNAGITFKLLIENLDQAEKSNYIAMKSLGSSNRVGWLYGLFAKQCNSYLSYCAYRSDILIRETSIVGLVGSIGLGWQLNEALSSFDWNHVFLILFAYGTIAVIGELINGKIKSILI